MMTNPIGSLTANNAAYNWMSSANALMGLSFRGGNSASLLAQENLLTTGMMQDQWLWEEGNLMQESQNKITKDNIKRTFSVFA